MTSLALSAAERDALLGSTIGHYTLDEYIGSGRHGHVFKGRHVRRQSAPLAIKIHYGEPEPGWDDHLDSMYRLHLVQGVVRLNDYGVVKLTAPLPPDGHYTVWDYIPPGQNLAQYIALRPVKATEMIAIVEEVLRILHLCRERGSAGHGDLHSGNILIGEPSQIGTSDDTLLRQPIYLTDFNQAGDDQAIALWSDYKGLEGVIAEMGGRFNQFDASSNDRALVQAASGPIRKMLLEQNAAERNTPLQLWEEIRALRKQVKMGSTPLARLALEESETQRMSLGQFQVSEMIGERWQWWKDLFVPSLIGRMRILGPDIPTIITGPRGCGKTMMLRRLSERVILESGEVQGLSRDFVGFYVNANDFADAFAHYPEDPSPNDHVKLIAYANLCFIDDILAVLAIRAAKLGESTDTAFLTFISRLIAREEPPLLVGEDYIEETRGLVQEAKWTFTEPDDNAIPGLSRLGQIQFLPHLLTKLRRSAPWIAAKTVLLFVDDYSTPRVSRAMQVVLNRSLLQRTPEFVAKVATEAVTTFVPIDSSDKTLQDGDDYQTIDLGTEALFLDDKERLGYLDAVFAPRLRGDSRVAEDARSLVGLLGSNTTSKTEFARRLRGEMGKDDFVVASGSQVRGASRQRAMYWGAQVFTGLWSGDTRTMIQLLTELADQQAGEVRRIEDQMQNRVFRERGGEWLESHGVNPPSDRDAVERAIRELRQLDSSFAFSGGTYGNHLKAIVEAFAHSARAQLLGPTYVERSAGRVRVVPRMAFRIEIVDEFRLDGLSREIYADLIRYGLFLRDNRGKSVRGTFVPRLYLRRLLIPFCNLPLSKRDHVPLTCAEFCTLLLRPDEFGHTFASKRLQRSEEGDGQIQLFDTDGVPAEYDDIGDEECGGE
jgi:hypothetical protein